MSTAFIRYAVEKTWQRALIDVRNGFGFATAREAALSRREDGDRDLVIWEITMRQVNPLSVDLTIPLESKGGSA